MKAFIAALKKAEQQLIPKISKALDEIADVAKNNARATTLFKGSPDGGLRAAIRIIANGSLSRTVLADKDYAGYVEYGNNQRGPYIYPVKAKALHFFVNGTEVFAKRVRSHGPLPFFEQAEKFTINKIPGIIKKHLKEIL